MHIVIIFHHVGGYHAARLRETHKACQAKGWSLTAVEVTDSTTDRPWGNSKHLADFPLRTLLPVATTDNSTDRSPFSRVAATKIVSCLASLNPDVVVIPGWGFPKSRVALSWCKKNKVPTVLMSESKFDDEPRKWWKEILKSWLYVRKYDAALVGGKTHKDYLIKLGFPASKIFLGYDVVDNDYFNQKAEEARENYQQAINRQPSIPQKPYFLTANRFIKRKNISRLLEAYADYCQKVTTEQAWDLVLCGSGEEEATIRQLIKKHQLESKVHLPGFITYDKMGDWYGLASAFIHPALQEQWGLVINEACAAGLPILCSNTVGAAYELIEEGNNGFLFSPESKKDMFRSLLKMHSLDEAAKNNMGKYSQQIVNKFHPKRFSTNLLNAIQFI